MMNFTPYDVEVAVCYEDGRWERRRFYRLLAESTWPGLHEPGVVERKIMSEVETELGYGGTNSKIIAIGLIEWNESLEHSNE